VFQDILDKITFWGGYKYPEQDEFKASVDPVLKAASLQMPPFAELMNAMQGRRVCEGCQQDEVDEG